TVINSLAGRDTLIAVRRCHITISLQYRPKGPDAGRDAGCYVSMSFASQNSKLKIRMDADFQQRKGLKRKSFWR
ncbi:MAG: hypothetical protein LBI85_04410, partial [Spirochaetaceae bacterium]|nr:hypothetical protein [Spirochaetaceae bacterium]